MVTVFRGLKQWTLLARVLYATRLNSRAAGGSFVCWLLLMLNYFFMQTLALCIGSLPDFPSISF